jgi:hypothetical protein
MKHHSQVFIALFVLILLMNIYPLQEGYTNKQTQIANIYSDISNNLERKQTEYNWLNTDIGGSSTEFKFSDNFNHKFKNPNPNPPIDTIVNIDTVVKPDFKLYDRYWPISDNSSTNNKQLI